MTEELKQQIDTSNNQKIEEKELLDFLKLQKENVKLIGDHLNKLQFHPNDPIFIATQEAISKISSQIENKVKKSQFLAPDELNVVKLEYILYEGEYLDEKQIYEELGKRYGNSSYVLFAPKPTSSSSRNSIVKPQSKSQLPGILDQNDLLSLKRDIESDSPSLNGVLPFIKYKEGYGSALISDLVEWIKGYDYIGYNEEVFKSETRHYEKKDSEVRKSYVERDLTMYAFNKYSSCIYDKELSIQKKAGYSTPEQFEKEVQAITAMQKVLEERKQKNFPNIDATIEKMEKYVNEIEQTTNKAGYFSAEDLKGDAEQYESFVKKTQKLTQEKKIQEISSQLQNPKITTGLDLETYFSNINILMEYEQTLEQLKGKNVVKYENYLKSLHTVSTKYGRENIVLRGEEIEKYSREMQAHKKQPILGESWKGFEKYRERFGEYNRLIEKSGISSYIESKIGIGNFLMDCKTNPLGKNNPFFGLEKETLKQQEIQTKTDKIRDQVRKSGPLYQIANFGVGAWNGLVDFTVGTGTSLGLMLEKIWKDDDQWMAEIDRQQKWTNFLKISQSSSQKEAIYDSEAGLKNLNVKRDNTVSAVGGQLSNMLALLSGAGAIGKGITKAGTKLSMKWITQNIASKTGLFTTAFIQNVGQSFTKGKTMGLSDNQALSYTLLTSLTESGLELISPNEAIMGSGTRMAKNYLKTLLGNGSKKELLAGVKVFGKMMGAEILEENLQEASQLAMGNVINLRANDLWNVKFEADFNWKNFAQTALLTTLTTGLATSKTAIQQGYRTVNVGKSDLQIIKNDIVNNPDLYEDMINVMEKVKEGKIKIPGVVWADVFEIKLELQQMKRHVDGAILSKDEKYYMDNHLIGKNLENLDNFSSKEENLLAFVSKLNLENERDIKNCKHSLFGACGRSSAILGRLLDHYRSDSGLNYQVYMHQMNNIRSGIRHAILTVQFSNGKTYILDNTFSQFLNTTFGSQDGKPLGDYVKNHPETEKFVEELISNGFIELNEKNAQIYESILLNEEVKSDQINLDAYLTGTDITIKDEISDGEFAEKFLKTELDLNQFQNYASLNDNVRLTEASKLLGNKELTDVQKQAILDAHNQEGTVYNLTSEQIRARVAILQNVGFSSGEIRVLFENGIVGKYAHSFSQESLDFTFEQTPELAQIGTQQQYAEYLSTIFPESQVKNILYHAGPIGITTFSLDFHKQGIGKTLRGKGIYFTDKLSGAERYAERLKNNKGVETMVYPAIIDLKNPKDGVVEDFSKSEYDGSILDKSNTEKGNVDYVLPYPERQIHILGSQQDIEGFKKFMVEKNEKNLLLSLTDTSNKLSQLFKDHLDFEKYVTEQNISKKGLEVFMNTEYGNQKIGEWVKYGDYDHYLGDRDMKELLLVLEKNPHDVIGKIEKLGDIEISKENLGLLIDAPLENIQFLMDQNLLTTEILNRSRSVRYEIGNIACLVPLPELKILVEKLGIKNYADLVKYKTVIVDPISSLGEKIDIIQNRPELLQDQYSYQNMLMLKYCELTPAEIEQYGSDSYYLNGYLENSTNFVIPDLGYENNLRLMTILKGYDAGSTDYYTRGFFGEDGTTRHCLTSIEEDALGNRRSSYDLAGPWLRKGHTLPVGRQIYYIIESQVAKKLPTYEGTAYRGINKSLSELESSLGMIAVGSIISDPVMSNFTDSKSLGESFSGGKTLFIIESKSGKYYNTDIEPHVLFKENTQMRVTKVEHNQDGMENVVYLEEVLDNSVMKVENELIISQERNINEPLEMKIDRIENLATREGFANKMKLKMEELYGKFSKSERRNINEAQFKSLYQTFGIGRNNLFTPLTNEAVQKNVDIRNKLFFTKTIITDFKDWEGYGEIDRALSQDMQNMPYFVSDDVLSQLKNSTSKRIVEKIAKCWQINNFIPHGFKKTDPSALNARLFKEKSELLQEIVNDLQSSENKGNEEISCRVGKDGSWDVLYFDVVGRQVSFHVPQGKVDISVVPMDGSFIGISTQENPLSVSDKQYTARLSNKGQIKTHGVSRDKIFSNLYNEIVEIPQGTKKKK